MRILMTSWAWPSHVLPMVPLGWAWRSRGHEVRLAAPPSVADLAARSGLPFVAAGSDVDIAALTARCFSGGTAGGPAERVSAMFTAVAGTMVDGLDAAVGAFGPDLVVHDATTWAGPLVAAGHGVPAVRHLFGPDMTARLGSARDEALAPLAARFAPHGVPADLCTVDPCPPSFQFPDAGPAERFRAVPYNGSGSVPDWIDRDPGRPRVCVTGGSALTAGDDGTTVVDAVLAAGADLGVEVVAAVPAGRAAGLRAPEGVRVVEDLPLHVLLPTCAALVHHGGAGSILAGLHHGVPQIALPGIPEAAVNAARMAATGVGPSLDTAGTHADLVRAVRAVLDDGPHRAAVRRMAAEVAAQPSPADCAATVEGLLRPTPALVP